MFILVDNFDSFTHILAHSIQQLGQDVRVVRNNSLTTQECLNFSPTGIVVGPGPGSPQCAGVSNAIIRGAEGKIPILGVCLGHQCIAKLYGGEVRRADRVMHGKRSTITHVNSELFEGIPASFSVTRYHSLVVDHLPPCLEVTASTSEGEIMALQHREFPTYGVQFHPEAVLTEQGLPLLENFISITEKYRGASNTPFQRAKSSPK